MAVIPKGFLTRPVVRPLFQIRQKAEEVAVRCGLNVMEKGDDGFILTVLDKLARDNSDLVMEIQSAEQQIAYLQDQLQTQTPAPTEEDEGNLFLTGDVAKLFGCTGETIRNYIKRGWLTGIQRPSNHSTGYTYYVVDDDKFRDALSERSSI